MVRQGSVELDLFGENRTAPEVPYVLPDKSAEVDYRKGKTKDKAATRGGQINLHFGVFSFRRKGKKIHVTLHELCCA